MPWVSKMWSSKSKEMDDIFMGWKWVCPSCGKTCRTISYPLPPMALVSLMKGGEIHRRDKGHPDAISPGNQTFACMLCRGVMFHCAADVRDVESADLAYQRRVAVWEGGAQAGVVCGDAEEEVFAAVAA